MSAAANEEGAPESGIPNACRTARTAMAEFLGQSGSAGRALGKRNADPATDFRRHLVECADCMSLYREAVASAARLGKSIREDLADLKRRRIHAGMQERARAATGDKRRKNRFGMRLALLPAAVALLILVVRGREDDRGLHIQWSGGEVVVAGQLMDKDRSEFRLEAGDWCETRGNALALVVAHAGGEERRLRLGARTALLVEDPAEGRVRLSRGELEVSGPAAVITAHGVLELEEGVAHLRLDGETYDLECKEGHLTWTGPLGVRELAAGNSVTAGSILADAE